MHRYLECDWTTKGPVRFQYPCMYCFCFVQAKITKTGNCMLILEIVIQTILPTWLCYKKICARKQRFFIRLLAISELNKQQ